jgi:hypothetical protein
VLFVQVFVQFFKQSGVYWCLIKLTIFVSSSKFFLIHLQEFWKQHLSVNKAVCCDVKIFCIREAKPLMEPTTDGSPSVQMPMQFSQDRPFVSRYEDKTLNISCSLLSFKQFFATEKVF